MDSKVRLPRVTVVTVSKDNLEEIKRTRATVRAQVYAGQIDHLIVDGGSRGQIREYLEQERSADQRFAFISEPDAGIYDAMNKGLALAEGDVIWWLNSGDTFSTRFSVSLAMDGAPSPREEWGFGATAIRSEDGQLKSLFFPNDLCPLEVALGFSYYPHPAAFVGAEFAKKLQPYKLSAPVVADQEFLLRAHALAAPRQVPSVLVDFYLGGVSSKRTWYEKHRELASSITPDLSVLQKPALQRRLAFFLFAASAVLRRISRNLLSAARKV